MKDIRLAHTPLAFLWHHVKIFNWQFGLLFLFLVIWALNETLYPYFIKLMIEETQTPLGSGTTLWQRFHVPITGLSITWITMEISMRLFGVIEVYLFPKFRAKMREDVFSWVKEQSLDYFTSNLAGSIGGKIADIPKSCEHIIHQTNWHIVASFLAIFFGLIVLAQASLVFTLLTVLWCAIHMVITFYYWPEIQEKTSSQYEALAKLNGETVDIIGNAFSMKLFSRVVYETARLQHYQNQEINKSIISRWTLEKVNLLRGFASLCFIFATIYLLLRGWQEAWLTIGDFPLVAMTSFSLMGRVWMGSVALLDIFKDLGTLRGALSLLRVDHKIKDKPDAIELVVHQGEIEFKNVTFGYHENNGVFSDLSVRIAPQEKVGLVGFSGSGKTTFINLILRAYELNNGQILIDGQDIKEVTQSSLRKQITLIPQDPSLFHRSIKENIGYGDLDATDQAIKEAAIKAHCHEFIDRLEQGYETTVGERGLKLSGGQRQRLAIARGFLKNSSILILDEATSALDSATEKYIQESLLKLMAGKTTIIIAHRLSTLKHMDRVLVFDKGKIIEQGTQAQLLNKNGHFMHLWSLQREGFLPDKENL
jgi:ATP-binding cassette subfamily B protein